MTPRRLWRTSAAFAALAVLLVFALPAFGQDAAAPPDVTADQLGQLLQLAVGSLSAPGVAKWAALALVAVLGAVYAVRWAAKGKTAKWAIWIRSDEGGTVLGWLASAAGALAVHLIGGGKLSLAEAGAVALGLRAGTAITWSDGRRILRVVSPLLRLVPKVGPPLAALLDALNGANAKAEIAKATAASYKPLSPAPDAQAAAVILNQPPVP